MQHGDTDSPDNCTKLMEMSHRDTFQTHFHPVGKENNGTHIQVPAPRLVKQVLHLAVHDHHRVFEVVEDGCMEQIELRCFKRLTACFTSRWALVCEGPPHPVRRLGALQACQSRWRAC